jgi:hypothetical protein
LADTFQAEAMQKLDRRRGQAQGRNGKIGNGGTGLTDSRNGNRLRCLGTASRQSESRCSRISNAGASGNTGVRQPSHEIPKKNALAAEQVRDAGSVDPQAMSACLDSDDRGSACVCRACLIFSIDIARRPIAHTPLRQRRKGLCVTHRLRRERQEIGEPGTRIRQRQTGT